MRSNALNLEKTGKFFQVCRRGELSIRIVLYHSHPKRVPSQSELFS